MMRRLLLFNLLLITNMASADVHTPRQQELKNLLIQDCGSCHGLTFKGGLGPALLPQTLSGQSRDFLMQTILEGRPGTAMPSWKGLLSVKDAAWITDRLIEGVEP